MKPRNYVAKHANTYNKAVVHKNKKLENKLGYNQKHKKRPQDGRFSLA